METVYLETSFISYLVARPSRDVIVAGHQQTTQDWWANRRSGFECVISQVVIDEALAGDSSEAQKRLAILTDLPELEITADAEALADAIMASGVLPPHVARDAAHIAVAAVHGMDYLLTWNCKHLANVQISRRVSLVCEKAGHRMPIICTPEELMGE
ncbi:MAG: type II toxin-antitoxin system VapC family toxin [Gemmataceae bacterium]